METLREIDQKRSVSKQQTTVPKSCFNFASQKQITFFSYQHNTPATKTHDLQRYYFLGQTNSHRLSGIW